MTEKPQYVAIVRSIETGMGGISYAIDLGANPSKLRGEDVDRITALAKKGHLGNIEIRVRKLISVQEFALECDKREDLFAKEQDTLFGWVKRRNNARKGKDLCFEAYILRGRKNIYIQTFYTTEEIANWMSVSSESNESLGGMKSYEIWRRPIRKKTH